MSTNKSEVAMKGQIHKRLTESFFPLLVVYYHYQFRTKKSLELSLDWLKTPKYPAAACQSRAIHEAAQYLLDSRKEHCKLLPNATEAGLLFVRSANVLSQIRNCSLPRARLISFYASWW
jgi:hypothetical protein